LAVEPTRNALERLRKNIVLNHVGDIVIVFEGVVSDRAGKATIHVVPGKEEYSSVGVMENPSIMEQQYASEEVASITVDELVARHDLNPVSMKVDVESGEHSVFSGAKKVLSTWRPVILSELSNFLLTKNGSSSMNVINLIRQYDYDVLGPKDPSGSLGGKAVGDIICFPKETGIARKIQAIVS
jgi:FkbM family methyltransferase